MKSFKKPSLLISFVVSVSFLSACTMGTNIDTNVTLCRRYFLKEYVSLVGNDNLYDDIPLVNKHYISSIYLTGITNEAQSHVDFHYDGGFEFFLSNTDGNEADYEQGSYTVSDSSGTTLITMNFKETIKKCKATFVKKSNNDIIITYLRVPYKMAINEVETDVYLWFFNGIFGGCPFSGEL